jgi:hypothetical protein
MLTAERALSAWSPQLPTKARLQSHPRSGAIPKARKVFSFKAERNKRQQNAARLARGVAQLRYINYGSVKLQYFLGSVMSVGYARYRRVHRQHSIYSR